ncbi:MAG: UrcA family protein [Candidatus Azotimanducaceae bacterium]|jgi:UrcA family protein
MTLANQLINGVFAATLATALALPMTAAAQIKTSETSIDKTTVINEVVHVTISDLDLTTAQGQRVLQSRVKNAAKTICGSTDRRIVGSLAHARANRNCFYTTYSNTIISLERHYETAALTVLARKPH